MIEEGYTAVLEMGASAFDYTPYLIPEDDLVEDYMVIFNDIPIATQENGWDISPLFNFDNTIMPVFYNRTYTLAAYIRVTDDVTVKTAVIDADCALGKTVTPLGIYRYFHGNGYAEAPAIVRPVLLTVAPAALSMSDADRRFTFS